MRVLHVIPSVGPLRGGPSVVVRQLARSLVKAGIETHVATTNDNADGLLDVPLNVPVGDDGVTYWYFPRQIGFYTVSWPLAAWLRDNVARFDVVHIHALFSFASLLAAFWARRRGVPYIVRPLGTLNTWGMTNRRPWLKQWSFRLLESRVTAHATLMHYTSEDERRQASSLGITTTAAIIPNAVADPEAEPAVRGAFRRKLGRLGGQDRRIVLFLSRLDEKKGLDLLLAAFVQIRQQVPGALLVIAGDGAADYVAHIKADALALGLGEDEVYWAGFLAGDEKRAAFADADVFVLPSYSENFGVSVAEAMASGLPVVVSDQTAIHHDVSLSSAGRVVRCDASEVAHAVHSILIAPQAAAAMGCAGAALVQRTYSLAAVTQQVREAYDFAIEHATRRTAKTRLGAISGQAVVRQATEKQV